MESTNNNHRPGKKYNIVSQKGGAKIGQGSFGCVVTPAIPCKGKRLKHSHKLISKIAHISPDEQDDYDIEMLNYEYLKKVDTKQRYTVGMLDECALDAKTALTRTPRDFLDTIWYDDAGTDVRYLGSDAKIAYKLSDDDLSKGYCNIDQTRKPRNMIQVNAGTKLTDILKVPGSKLNVMLQQNLRKVMRDLLLGLKVMHGKEFAHRDIKPDNIVILPVASKSRDKSKEYPLARYIDFGLSEIVKTLNPKNIMNVNRQGTFGYMPIELIVLDEIRNYIEEYGVYVNLAAANVKHVILSETYALYNERMKEKYSKLKINKSFTSISGKIAPEISKNEYVTIHDIAMLYDKFIEEFRNGIFRDKYYSKIKGYVYKTDIFALGMVFRILVKFLDIENEKINDLIKHMLQINPDDRYDAVQCLAHPLFQ
jgi:serine/threonine protein kinase